MLTFNASSWDAWYMLLPSPLPLLALSLVLPLQCSICALAPHLVFGLCLGWPLLFDRGLSRNTLKTYSIRFSAFLLTTTHLFLCFGLVLWLVGVISIAAVASFGLSAAALVLVFGCNLMF
jgi:hypothetical protein